MRTVTALPLTLSTPLHSWLMLWPLARVHCTVQPFVATDELLVTVTVVCQPPGQELSTWYDAPHPVPAEVGVGDVLRDGLALGLGDADIAGVVAALEGNEYQGWYVLEQDTVLDAEPGRGDGPAADVRACVAYLEGLA